MPLRTTDDQDDRSLELRDAIDHTGYYPDVVIDSVSAAVSGERVVSFYVHHEPTFDRDEVRRHLSVMVLTPSRLIIVHTDEHAGDDLLPEPYTSTSSEAIRLSSVTSVVVTRMVANPTKGPTTPAEAVITLGWGGVSRVDLEPAGCDDPQCEADHGYTGVLASDDFSLRVSAAADGQDAVARLLSFAEQLSGPDPPGVSDPAFVEPAYGHRGLGDVVPAIGRALGSDVLAAPTGLVLPEAPAYVLFLVDGLGSRLLERYAATAPYLSSLLADSAPGTAGVPSTTATSLTSLGTGLTPGTHGLVGFTSRVPGTDRLLNALFWDKSVDPLEWQPHPTAFSRLTDAGVRVDVVNKREFDRSGLTIAAQRGAGYIGADRIGERIAGAVVGSTHRPSLTYLYDGDLDWTGHKYGVDSPQWLQQLAAIDAETVQLREALPDEVRLVVVADHGMVDSTPASRMDVDQHDELRDGLVLLGGEARFRHLYCADGAASSVAGRWAELLGDRADVLLREDAIARGWFGPVTELVLPRLGDVMVAARDDLALFSSKDFGYEMSLVGLHGSLTSDEMLIPILVG